MASGVNPNDLSSAWGLVTQTEVDILRDAGYIDAARITAQTRLTNVLGEATDLLLSFRNLVFQTDAAAQEYISYIGNVDMRMRNCCANLRAFGDHDSNTRYLNAADQCITSINESISSAAADARVARALRSDTVTKTISACVQRAKTRRRLALDPVPLDDQARFCYTPSPSRGDSPRNPDLQIAPVEVRVTLDPPRSPDLQTVDQVAEGVLVDRPRSPDLQTVNRVADGVPVDRPRSPNLQTVDRVAEGVPVDRPRSPDLQIAAPVPMRMPVYLQGNRNPQIVAPLAVRAGVSPPRSPDHRPR